MLTSGENVFTPRSYSDLPLVSQTRGMDEPTYLVRNMLGDQKREINGTVRSVELETSI